jgi:hypothetical protein
MKSTLALSFLLAALPLAASDGDTQALTSRSLATASPEDTAPQPWSPIAQTVRETCFSSGERTEGMNKICYYKCPSGNAAITVSAVSLCPLSIQR